MKNFGFVTLVITLLFTCNSFAQVSMGGKDCLGTWKTIDDETGRVKSHVEISQRGGKYYGKIVKLLDPQTLKDAGVETFEEVVCSKCPEGRGKDAKMLGLEIVWDMEKGSDKWSGGSIMDPKKGKEYTCTMWMDDSDNTGNTLKVRGWVAFFYRTQTWYRIN